MTPINMQRLSSCAPDFAVRLAALTVFEAETDAAIENTVSAIMQDVKARGDAAVLEYTQRFDQRQVHSMAQLEVPRGQWQAALEALPAPQKNALEQAAARVRAYHQAQFAAIGSHGFRYTEADGTVLGQTVTPLDRVGIYVPGGKAAYPSSVLMNAIPAKVAGVQEIIMVTPAPKGDINPLVLAAAQIAGVDKIFTIGGAQAVAALAYGTTSITAVDKIVGPGNAYVASAKRRVFGTVGIDMIAGPSEILIIADGSTDPDWIAMDLFSQAEHDELAQAILLCPDEAYLNAVAASINTQLPKMPRARIISASLTKRGALIHTRSMEEACAIANQLAPEHLEISALQPEHWAAQIRHAGALFLGAYSSEALGDYCAGPNHVLPTSRTARFSSPLGVYDFQKRSSLIHASPAGAQTLGALAVELAQGEGLQAHAQSAAYRILVKKS